MVIIYFLVFLFLLLNFFIGFFSSFVWPEFSLKERVFASFPLGFFLSSVFIFVFCHLFSFNLWLIFGCLAFLLILTGGFWQKLVKKKQFVFTNQDFRGILSVFLIFIPIVYWLFDRTMLKSINGSWYTSNNNYGDLPWHLQFITNFTYGQNFPPTHPIFPPARLSFHFFIDFLSSCFLLITDSLRLSLLIPGVILTTSMIFLSFFFFKRLTRSFLLAFLAVFIFFFHGNLGLVNFYQKFTGSGLSVLSFLKLAAVNYWEFNNFLCSFLGAYLIAQRAYLFGFNIFLLVMFSLYFALNRPQKSLKYLLIASSLTALSFFFDAHACLSLVIILLACFGFSLIFQKSKIPIKSWLYAGFLGFILLVPQFLWILPNLTLTNKFIQFKPGWQPEGIILFWWQNLWLLLPTGILGYLVKGKLNANVKLLATSTLPIFLVYNLFLIAPHSGDNNRIIYYPLFFLSLGAANFLYFLWQKSRLLLPIIIFLLILFTGSGLISIYTRNQQLFPLYSAKDIQTGLELRSSLHPQSVVLTAPEFNQIINTISGRRIFLGFNGYVLTQGFPYSQRQEISQKIYQGSPEALNLIKENKIDYIFVGPQEKKEYLVNEEFFRQNFNLLWQNNNLSLYQLKNPNQ